MRSTGVDLFQILDVLLGAVAYDYKLNAGLITGHNPKMRMLNHIKNRFDVRAFVGGHHGERLNVKEFGSAARAARGTPGSLMRR
jgi:hypothetical protein